MKGMKRGEDIDMKKGYAEGSNAANVRNAKRMLAKGLPIEDVQEFTELPMDVLIALQQCM